MALDLGVAASVAPLGCSAAGVAVNGEVMASLALPYAELNAVPTVDNCPFVFDAQPVSPDDGAATDASDVRVGQIDGRVPCVVVQPRLIPIRPNMPRVEIRVARDRFAGISSLLH